ncbi:hypothetical protein SAMN02787118_101209 [Streptomyces mirabilis]|uniref:Uncharacterized protein n=1 Tax=Streptomyces mirabilis TaxID=68239 RepID=A0A1I1ZAL7_9ACTN|nr:hypothetical protein SAMN02787118_101209 [Streptomyces mirabilis]
MPHAEPPLSAVLLEPLHLCEPRLHREAHRGVVDGRGAQHHRLVGRRGEPVQLCTPRRRTRAPTPPAGTCSRARPPRLPEPLPATAVHGFPAGAGNRPRSTLCGSRSTASSPLQDGQSHQLRQVMKRPVAKSLRLSSPRRDRPPQLLTQAAIKIRAMLGPGPTHRSLNRIRAAQRRADHVSPADEAPPGVLLGEAAGLLPVAEKGCLTRSDVRQAPLGPCRARLRRGVGGMRPPARRPCPRRGPARSPTCGDRSALACEV